MIVTPGLYMYGTGPESLQRATVIRVIKTAIVDVGGESINIIEVFGI